MPIRIPWDIHEIVFLIDMCKKVENRELSRVDAVTQTSVALRQKAINAGIEIDDVYRNENGISFQMNIMLALLDDEECKLHSASKMFRKGADLYKNNPHEFAKILTEAKQLVSTQTPRKANSGEAKNGLKKKRLDLLRVGDMAYTSPVSFKYSFHNTKEVASWNELYIEIVRWLSKDYPSIVVGNKSFSDSTSFDVGDKRASKKMKKSVRVKPGLYIDTGIDTASKLRRIRNMLNACSLETDVIQIKYVFDEKEKAVHDIEELIRKNKASLYTVEWGVSLNYSGTKPLSYRYKKCRYEQVNTWTGLWISFLTRIYKDHPQKLRSSFTYGKGTKPDIGMKRHAKKMVRPVEFANGIYAETNLSSNSIVERIYAVMRMIKMSESELKINYISKDDIVFWGGSSQMGDSVWEGFLQWLQAENTPVVARDILSNISILNALGRKNKKLKTAISQITVTDEITRLITEVTDIKAFGIHSRKMANSICRALNIYKQYLSTVIEAQENKVANVSEERAKFIEWMESARIAPATISSYLSALNQCSKALKEYEITSEDVLVIENAELLIQYRDILLTRTDFKALNEQQHNRFKSALNKLIDYRSGGEPIKLSSAPLASTSAQQVIPQIPLPDFASLVSVGGDSELERFEAVLSVNFSEGLLPNALRLDKFRMLYENEYGTEPTQNDDLLIAQLKKAGSFIDGRIYPKKDKKQNNLIANILTEVIKTLNSGARCVFTNCVMKRWQHELANQLNVYNEDTLRSLLASQNVPGLYVTDTVLKATVQKVYPEENVVELMKESHSGMNYQQLQEILWYIPMDTIKLTLVRTPQMVNVDAETYFYAPNFPASHVELQHLKQCMAREIAARGYLAAPDVARIIRDDCKTIAINTAEYKDWAYRNILRYIFRDDFEFGSSIITEKGNALEMWQVYRGYCRNHERISLDDLKTLKDELGVTIYWDTVMSEMVRINKDELIRRDLVHFDIKATDKVLDEMCPGDYVSLKDIRLFLHFPPIEHPWNEFVLESYLQESNAFKLYHASFANHGAFGVIVRSSSRFHDYQSVVVDMLAHSNEWSNTKEALELIVEKGYQARKRWTNFEQVTQEAGLLREKLEQERM